MSFFKDLKEDIAQSVNELADSLDENVQEEETNLENSEPDTASQTEDSVSTKDILPEADLKEIADEIQEKIGNMDEIQPEELNEAAEEEIVDEPEEQEEVKEDAVDAVDREDTKVEEEVLEPLEDNSEEVTVITKGTTISGGIRSDTSLVVKGKIDGDVECAGKLTITGSVSGNTIASEIYVNTPRLAGDINSKGLVKIDVGTVVLGNINCTSVVIAGAVKGDVEVNGPVVIDSTAVVKGNINAKSLQINSGAVIDGHCSLKYADVDLDSFFE